MAKLFWIISQGARIKLMQHQAWFKDKPILDIAGEKAPWEMEPIKQEMPVDIGEDLDKFMRQKPKGSSHG